MSGNYTQRGEPSLLPKMLRAEAALRCGADLIIEIPSAYSLLSAEGFAFAGVYILNSLGIITDLSFGAETDCIESLNEIASLLTEHETARETLLCMKSGISYAAAREKALYEKIKEKSGFISQPNNILAVEYLKAIKKLKSNIAPHAIKRFGASHDSGTYSNENISASAIRDSVRRNDLLTIKQFMPESSFDILLSALEKGQALNDNSIFERIAYSHLIKVSKESIKKFPDVSEGLENRIYNAIRSSPSVELAALNARSKRYPLSRIKRIMLRVFLELYSDYSISPPPYCRVLGFNDKGQYLLSMMRDTSKIPVITKTAHIHKLSEQAIRLFEAEAIATDLYNSALPDHADFPNGYDWRIRPVRI
jgi:predicted nucleotidyltransferase